MTQLPQAAYQQFLRVGTIVAVFGLVACAGTSPATDADVKAGPTSAVANGPVRPQDDMYRAVNGPWLATHEIPADRSSWGVAQMVNDQSIDALRNVVNTAEAAGPKGTSDQRKVAALYDSFMDAARLDALGARPIAPQMRAIDAIRSKREIPAVIAQFNEVEITAPYLVYISVDAKDPTHYVPIIYQSGLGLPDRDYYLKDDDEKLKAVRTKYQAHIATMLTLANVPNATDAAGQVVDLETRLARVSWTNVENRDPVKTYNKVSISGLDAMTPGFAWKNWVSTAHVAGKVNAVVVAQPSYLKGFAETLDAMPLDAWKAYFKYHVIASAAPYLSKPFADEAFAFDGTVLSGTPVELPRWRRAINTVEPALGEALGKLYVAKYFPPENKARIDTLVMNLLAAYKISIDQLDWMGPETKKEAQAKLAKFDPKVGYPVKWRDYTALTIRRDDLLGNVMRGRRFEYDRENAKLGRPIDRDEWGMTPQTVNAYYSPRLNGITFPAAILQPPYFDTNADDATNYGAIGSIIGHEISHGFDDQGSQSDGDGRLRNWWTDDDRQRFNAKTKALVAQFDAFEPVAGYHINGAQTLGENIADNSGLAVAYKAYELSLHGKPAPIIDGKTGEQRFYIGFASVWPAKFREPLLIRILKSDPHSPNEFRANATLRNQPPFYDAFGVKPGDGMYLPPDRRVVIW